MSPINQIPVVGTGLQIAAVVAVVAAVTGYTGCVACGGGATPGNTSVESGGGAETVVVEVVETPVAAGTVTISGTVKFEGNAPKPAIIRMSADASCEKAHGDTKVMSEEVVLGPTGGLANVYIHISKGLEGKKFPVPANPAVLDQVGCVYVPHVLGIMAGQQLDIVSSDNTLHNVHCMGKDNPEFNFGMPAPGRRKQFLRKPEIGVKFKCDVHPWMGAWVHVSSHPFFAVTDADGAWTIKGLPPGSYTLAAWHETFGQQEQAITVSESGAEGLAFTFKQ